MKKGRILVAGSLVLCLLGTFVVQAAGEYPTKPITFICPWGPGGMGDVTGRILSKYLEKYLGQPIVFTNRPGGGAAVGLTALANAKPDGYTIGNGHESGLLMPPRLRDVAYNLESFDIVGAYVRQEMVLYSREDRPWTTFEEFIEYAKENIVTVGEAGEWEKYCGRWLAREEELKWRAVRFLGGGENSAALLGGHVDLAAAGEGTPVDLAAREGQIRMMVIFTRGHIPNFPDVKNLEDYGYDFYMLLARYVLVPAGTPEPIRKKLEDAVRKATANPEFQAQIKKINITPKFLSGPESEQLLKDADVMLDTMLSKYPVE